jgi:uncharacterized protein (DUF433 family)
MAKIDVNSLHVDCGKRYDEDEGREMANVKTDVEIDWMACELIEAVPGKVSGRPVVRGTRILPDAILNSYELGDSIEEIHEGFPTLSIVQIKRLIEFGLGQIQQHTS